MKKQYILVLFSMVALFFAGCNKERTIDGLYLVAEGARNGDSKLIIDGDYSEWASGDEVRINGTTAEVQLTEGGAYITGGGYKAPFYGIYPASIYTTNSGASYTVNIPGEYTYAASGGKQVLQSPMAGYADNGNYVFFKHLTSAICVKVTNYYGFTVEVDSVIIISSNSKLHGELTFTVGEEISIPAVFKSGGDTVVMLGGGLQIVSGNTVNVQVPVLPQYSGNLFTLQVKVHKYNNTDVKRRFDKTQTNSYILARNQIMNASMTVGFPFTVGNGRRVIFSQGNLQYKASSPSTWQFAANQYDHIGNAAGNNVFGDDRATQSSWIDLFGWGTSGWDNNNTNYMPYINWYTSTTSAYGYGPRTNSYTYNFDLTGTYANADWGVYNSISNGGNVAGLWRTLSSSEWTYLLNTRSDDTRFAKAKVNDVDGVILFPDNFSLPNGFSTPSNVNETGIGGWTGNVYDEIDWAKMEAMGAVFLPVTGRTVNATVESLKMGYYWTTTQAGTKAYEFSFGSSILETASIARYYGCAVRVVRDID